MPSTDLLLGLHRRKPTSMAGVPAFAGNVVHLLLRAVREVGRVLVAAAAGWATHCFCFACESTNFVCGGGFVVLFEEDG